MLPDLQAEIKSQLQIGDIESILIDALRFQDTDVSFLSSSLAGSLRCCVSARIAFKVIIAKDMHQSRCSVTACTLAASTEGYIAKAHAKRTFKSH